MTAHNRHLLAEAAYKANREAAAREERERIVNHLRRKASEADKEAMAAYDEYLVTLIPTRRLQGLIQGHLCAELRNLADQIERGEVEL